MKKQEITIDTIVSHNGIGRWRVLSVKEDDICEILELRKETIKTIVKKEVHISELEILKRKEIKIPQRTPIEEKEIEDVNPLLGATL